MTMVSELMSRGVPTLSPWDSAVVAACLMEKARLSMVPVCDAGQFVGVVTERDIAVAAVARGLPVASTPVGSFMTVEVERCMADQTVEEVAERFAANNSCRKDLRKVPVVDRSGQFLGLLSLP